MAAEEDTIYSISAHIDLLGFSSHLVLSSYDLRTKIGGEAIQRLRIIEAALEFLEQEVNDCKDFYPETIRFLRFNDSLILGIDINLPILPKVGMPNEIVTFTWPEIEKFFAADSDKDNLPQKIQDHFHKESFNVSKFIGLTSRIHNFINKKEFEIQMPGCRTIISSGLRYKFVNKKDNKEDFYSANFSLSNAYIVNELGSKQGFHGNKCYIEDNVAQICCHNIYTKRALGFTKFIRYDLNDDPFNGITGILIKPLNYFVSKRIEVSLFNKKYNFRELNTVSASNLQFFPAIISLIEKEFDENSFINKLMESLKHDTPSLDSLMKEEGLMYLNYPFLYFDIPLEEKIDSIFNGIKNYPIDK